MNEEIEYSQDVQRCSADQNSVPSIKDSNQSVVSDEFFETCEVKWLLRSSDKMLCSHPNDTYVVLSLESMGLKDVLGVKGRNTIVSMILSYFKLLS